MNSSTHIQEVTSKRDLRAFIKFPWQVYKGDPKWVPLEAGWQIETVGDAYRFYLEGMPTMAQRPSLAGGLAEG